MKPVLHSFAYCLDYLREQVADVAAAEMVAQPKGIVNHPAWVIGHLTLSCELLGEVIGLPAWLPERWAERFGPGSVPVADVGAYETKENALAILRDAQVRITQAIERLEATQLDAPFPQESLRDVFPTVRHALTHVMLAYTAHHIGQITVWRRIVGLPRMARSFE
jgi:hypothetical protein